MKKFLFLLTGLLLSLGLSAQPFDPQEIVPLDPEVRTGVLPNGATYYIRHNAKPAQRGNFHIYYKVGAIEEEDNQNGLAHFLEHMAFNGSEHFPENTMIDYLSTIGVRFGENLNAWTSQENTSYMIINVPLVRETIVDSVLLILHDWAGYISLDAEDIDKERGVIIEEWRQGNNASRRIFEKQGPVLYNNSLYARRNVIGYPEGLQSFSYDELRDFYHKWYRPDMQAFVIVGDFDVDEMEQKLIRTMADIPAAEVKAPRREVRIPDNSTPLVSVATDPEQTMTVVQMLFRNPPLERALADRYAGFKRIYMNEIVGTILRERLAEIARQEDAPFLGASASYSPLVRTSDVFFVGGSARDGEALRTLEALETELARLIQGGYTQSELDRAKTGIWRRTENYYENRNDRTNGQFVNYYTEHFEHGTPYLSAEEDLKVTRRVLDAISLEDVNALIRDMVHEDNRTVLISMPAKDDLPVPTESEVLAVIERVRLADDILAYEDHVQDVPLLDESVLPGSPVVTTESAMFGSTAFTLGNGVRVIVKHTDLKADEVVMSAFQKGGSSTLTDLTDFYNLGMVGSYLQLAGVGQFTSTELQKMLTGKLAGVTPVISSLTQGFSGSSSPKDLETLMQLIYLYYTAPRFEQGEWNVLMNQYRSMLPNVVKNPNYIFQDSVSQTIYGHDPRVFQTLSEKVLDAVSLEGTASLYRRFFSNADGMTFVFVGNVDAGTLIPLAEKYLGSLPAQPHRTGWSEDVPRPVEGVVENIFATRLETPLVSTLRVYSAEIPYTLEKEVNIDALRYILEMRYTKSIREEKGGTYGVSVGASLGKVPVPRYIMQVFFQTDADKLDELLPIVQQEIDDILAGNITAEELTKTREFFLKRYRDGLIHNGTWLGYLTSYYQNDNDRYQGYEEIISSLSAESIRAVAAEAFAPGNVTTVIQMPE